MKKLVLGLMFFLLLPVDISAESDITNTYSGSYLCSNMSFQSTILYLRANKEAEDIKLGVGHWKVNKDHVDVIINNKTIQFKKYEDNGSSYYTYGSFFCELEKKFTTTKSSKNKYNFSNSYLNANIKHTIKGNNIVIKVKVKNLYKTSAGGVSLSFPQFKNNKKIIDLKGIDFSSTKSYPKNSKLWSGAKKKSIYSNYLLVEGWTNRWEKNQEKILSIVLNKNNLDKLIINFRALLVKNRNEKLLPDSSNYHDQQDYPIKKITIQLSNTTKKTNSKNINLKKAIKKEDFKKVIELIEAGSDVNTVDEFGYNALMIFANSNNYKYNPITIAKKLKERGININAQNNDGDTALMIASFKAYSEMAKTLGEESTVIENKKKLIKWLVKNNADKTLKNKQGKTAYDIAKTSGFGKDILALLK